MASELTFEVGLPIRNSFSQAVATLQRAMQIQGVTSIHLSVNEPGEDREKFLGLAEVDARVRVTLQRQDLGLYGNLRFLVNSANSFYFSWLCYDDVPPIDFLSSAMRADIDGEGNKALYVPAIGQQHFNDVDQWHGPLEVWPLFDYKIKPRAEKLFLGFRTHYIYGVWKRQYLAEIFPKRNFDWLDALLLARTIADEKIANVASGTYVVGVVDKFPTKVGTKHRLWPWAVRTSRLIFSSGDLIGNLRGYFIALVTFAHINHYWNMRERFSGQKQVFKSSLYPDKVPQSK